MKVYCFWEKTTYPYACKFLISSRDVPDKMAASIESYCEMYKRPYLLNRSTDLPKMCDKMFASNSFLLKWQLKFVGSSLKNLDWDMGKQRRPTSDAAERGVWIGSALFA